MQHLKEWQDFLGTGTTFVGQVAWEDYSQLSTTRSGTRENSRTLLVTRGSPKAKNVRRPKCRDALFSAAGFQVRTHMGISLYDVLVNGGDPHHTQKIDQSLSVPVAVRFMRLGHASVQFARDYRRDHAVVHGCLGDDLRRALDEVHAVVRVEHALHQSKLSRSSTGRSLARSASTVSAKSFSGRAEFAQ